MITIGIPAYNVEKYITRCLLSVENQSYKDIEVVIVEDCSTDNTLFKIESFLKNTESYKTYKLIKNLKNKGLAFNRNRIIEEATGEYIFFLDSDDEIPSNCIELLFNKINNTEYDFVCGGIQYIANNSIYNEFFQNYSSQYQKYAFANFLIKNKFKYHNEVWNKLYRKSFLLNNDLKFVDVKSHEDSIFTFQVMVNCKSFGMIAEPVYKYYQYPKSMSHDITPKQYIDFIKIKNEFRKLLETDLYKKCPLAYDIYISQMIFFSQFMDSKNLPKELRNKYIVDYQGLIRIKKFTRKLIYLNLMIYDNYKIFKIFNAIYHLKSKIK